MSENVVIVNTHPAENPEFVRKLVDFLALSGIEPEVLEGYDDVKPLDRSPSHIILSGVPMSANYSLAETDTQRVVERAFGWLRECKCPVLGICYGHQILAQIFGGEVSSSTAPRHWADNSMSVSASGRATEGSSAHVSPSLGRLASRLPVARG